MKKTQLLGILNCTPDSFFDGGHYYTSKRAIERGLQMIDEGADMIDIGGESSRPSATPVSTKEEIERVLPVITALQGKIPLSIDTTKAEVARIAAEEGISMINDITAGSDPKMVQVAIAYQTKFCAMHMQGTPQTMQLNPLYSRGVVTEIFEWFEKKIEYLEELGLAKENLILDPGIGFGKTPEDCLMLINNIHIFCDLGYPILIGLSRKSFMSKILGLPSTELLSTTIAMNTMCLLEGAMILRVHDVLEHRGAVDAVYHLRKAECSPILVSSSQSSKSSY